MRRVERGGRLGNRDANCPWFEGHAVTLEPHVTYSCQGMPTGAGGHAHESGGKADFLLCADLAQLHPWHGLSLTVHPEQDFGARVNVAAARACRSTPL